VTAIIERLYGPVVVEADLPATNEVVYAVLTDPTTYPEWLVGAQDIRAVDPDFPAPGADFHHSVGASDDLTVKDRTTSRGANPPYHLVLEVRARPFFRGIVEFVLRPDGDGTEVVQTERPAGAFKLLAPLVHPLVAARNEKSLQQLDDVVRSHRERAQH
jgi:uncharacterized protein YndB with AHSA1/START domain